jgi:putative ABC transport system permease protein
MIIFDTLQTALAQLTANKLRTGLTMLGIVIGVGAVIALMGAGEDFGTGSSVTTVVAPWSIFVALGVSAIIGLFFGSYPAFRVSRLNPIEALRTE